jgi:TonB family protein
MKQKIFLFSLFLLAGLTLRSQNFNVQVLPTNVGGKLEFKRVFEQELMYPEEALKNKVGGKTLIGFIVKRDSTLSDIKLTSSGNASLDAEAYRIFRLLQWVPAVQDGQYISTFWNVTFDFNPSKYAKICRDRGYVKMQYPKDETVDTSISIVKIPEQYPMFPAGNFALQDFIKENLEYPRQAQVSNIQGTVVLRFVVEPSGLVTNIGVEKSVGGGCDQEAIRVLGLIKWYPGKKDGKLLRVQMTFPFYFILNDEFKDNSAGEQK